MRTDKLVKKLLRELPDVPCARSEADRILGKIVPGISPKHAAAAVALAAALGKLDRMCGGTVIVKCTL